MRRLMLLRHAKSDWPAGADDRERPLAPRGRRASARMGRYLADSGLVPDLAIISPARRAWETWEGTKSALARQIPEQVEPRIYAASAEAILRVIAETTPQVHTLLLVGHNPGFYELARILVGSGSRSDRTQLARKLPTTGLVVIDFDGEHWWDTAAGLGHLERFATPESIGDPAGDD